MPDKEQPPVGDGHEIDDGKDFMNIIIRVVALVLGLIVFVTDKYMHLLDPPLSDGVYMAIGAIAMGNKQAMAMIGMGKH